MRHQAAEQEKVRFGNISKIVIWGLGADYNSNINSIKYQELCGYLRVIGVTDANNVYPCLDGYSFVMTEDLKDLETDYIVVTTKKYYNEICALLCSWGYERERILPVSIFRIPNFNFNEYVKLLNSKISIIAQTCWGGVTSHYLGLKFRSPFINLSISDEDYIRLLKNLKTYLNMEMKFLKYEYWTSMGREIPIAMLGDIRIRLVHYNTYEEGKEKWCQRLKRINWDNLFVMIATDCREIAEEFDTLQFDRKICFAPFESQCASVHTVHIQGASDGTKLKHIVNAMAEGKYPDYDVIRLLNSGQVNHDRYL